MVLVSTADPGSLDQESYAGAKAVENLSPSLRQVIAVAPPVLPQGSVADVETGVLDALR
jgi:hypothetical protein